MKKIALSLTLSFLALAGGTAHAGGAVAGATEFTQVANMGQLMLQYATQVKQYTNQIQQWQNMLTQGRGMSASTPWSQTESLLMRIASATNQNQALGYNLARTEKQFQNSYPQYNAQQRAVGSDYYKQYAQWSNTSRDSIQASLRAGGMQAENFQTEAQTAAQLREMSKTAEGRMQAIQVGNAIAAEQLDDSRKLRQIIIAQNQAHGAYMEGQQKKNDRAVENEQTLSESFTKKDSNSMKLQDFLSKD